MFKSFLKYINSIPFSLTIKHYQTFGYSASLFKNAELNSAESWDALRTTHPQFSISQNRKEWLRASEAQIKKDGQDRGLLQRAKDVESLLKKENKNSIFSVGVGGAGLEYQLKKINPNLKIVCSEFAPQNVELLKSVFLEADQVVQFDILNGDWKSIKEKYLFNSSVCLMYRVDASFSDEEWRYIFEKLHAAKINDILFIPSSFLSILSIFNRKWREIRWTMSKTKVVFSGYLRTKSTFKSYWNSLYNEKAGNFGGINGFLLTIK